MAKVDFRMSRYRQRCDGACVRAINGRERISSIWAMETGKLIGAGMFAWNMDFFFFK